MKLQWRNSQDVNSPPSSTTVSFSKTLFWTGMFPPRFWPRRLGAKGESIRKKRSTTVEVAPCPKVGRALLSPAAAPPGPVRSLCPASGPPLAQQLLFFWPCPVNHTGVKESDYVEHERIVFESRAQSAGPPHR